MRAACLRLGHSLPQRGPLAGRRAACASLRETPRITLSAPCTWRHLGHLYFVVIPPAGRDLIRAERMRFLASLEMTKVATPLGARAVMRGSSWSATLVGELRVKRAVLAVNAVSRKLRPSAV